MLETCARVAKLYTMEHERERRGISQETLADMTYTSRSTINKIENGRLKPDVDLAERIDQAIGTHLADTLHLSACISTVFGLFPQLLAMKTQMLIACRRDKIGPAYSVLAKAFLVVAKQVRDALNALIIACEPYENAQEKAPQAATREAIRQEAV